MKKDVRLRTIQSMDLVHIEHRSRRTRGSWHHVPHCQEREAPLDSVAGGKLLNKHATVDIERPDATVAGDTIPRKHQKRHANGYVPVKATSSPSTKDAWDGTLNLLMGLRSGQTRC